MGPCPRQVPVLIPGNPPTILLKPIPIPPPPWHSRASQAPTPPVQPPSPAQPCLPPCSVHSVTFMLYTPRPALLYAATSIS